jgi:hypothetical protein
LYAKQIASLGAPIWPTSTDARFPTTDEEKSMSYPAYLRTLDTSGPITVWALTTDGGSDQIKFRDYVKYEVKYHPCCVVFDASCLQHKNALITKTLLLQIDKWLGRNRLKFRYYSSIAKVIHVWREYNRSIYTKWAALFGAISANNNTRTLVPRCIAGRWGSIFSGQRRILGASRECLTPVIVAVLEGYRMVAGNNIHLLASSSFHKFTHGIGLAPRMVHVIVDPPAHVS